MSRSRVLAVPLLVLLVFCNAQAGATPDADRRGEAPTLADCRDAAGFDADNALRRDHLRWRRDECLRYLDAHPRDGDAYAYLAAMPGAPTRRVDLTERAQALGSRSALAMAAIGWQRAGRTNVARELVMRSAEAGEPMGLYLLGIAYENGWSVAQDRARARDLYHRAATLGHAPAKDDLADLDALLALDMAPVRLRDARTCVHAGGLNEQLDIVRLPDIDAVALCEAQVAQQPDDGKSWAALANAYRELCHFAEAPGTDRCAVRHDLSTQAAQRALALGEAAGAVMLGLLAEQQGAPDAPADVARTHFRQAAAMGSRQGKLHLALLAEDSDDAAQTESLALLHEAAADGHAGAALLLSERLARLHGNAPGVTGQRVLMRDAATQGWIGLLCRHGWQYAGYGNQLTDNPARALRWLSLGTALDDGGYCAGWIAENPALYGDTVAREHGDIAARQGFADWGWAMLACRDPFPGGDDCPGVERNMRNWWQQQSVMLTPYDNGFSGRAMLYAMIWRWPLGLLLAATLVAGAAYRWRRRRA